MPIRQQPAVGSPPTIAVMTKYDARMVDAKLSVFLDEEHALPKGRCGIPSVRLAVVGPGPTLRMGPVEAEEAYREAAAAMQSVWPALR